MQVHQQNTSHNGSFIATENGNNAGRMIYTWAGKDKFTIDHTEVAAEFKGRGVGTELVMAAVHFARENMLKIIPLCPFARNLFEKTESIRDVLV